MLFQDSGPILMFETKKGKLAVLGDWFHRPSYAIFDGEKLDLVNWTSNEK